MITELTKEQNELIPTYLKKWLDIGRSINGLEKIDVENSVTWLYENILKIPKPKYVILLDSPMQCL